MEVMEHFNSRKPLEAWSKKAGPVKCRNDSGTIFCGNKLSKVALRRVVDNLSNVQQAPDPCPIQPLEKAKTPIWCKFGVLPKG